MNGNVTQAQKTICNIIGHRLFDIPLKLEDNVDWQAVIRESRVQAIFMLAFENYYMLPIGEENIKNLQLYLMKCTASNINCFNGHSYLHTLMTENEVPYCTIKGVASARYYPNPMLRNMGDVDFYISSEHLDRAREIFVEDGFEFKDEAHPHHYVMRKDTMRFEMHFAPIAPPKSELSAVFSEYWSDIYDEASTFKGDLAECVVPSDFHHGFILLTHFRSHLITSGVGIRHVCDWAVFVNSFSNDDFVAVFEKRLKRAGLWHLAQAISLVAVNYFGMQHKAWMGDDCETADALMEDILRGGNFGKQEKDRGFHTVFLESYDKSGDKSRVRWIFSSLNVITRKKWRIARKCPLLYPVGWVYFPLRFLIRRTLNRRKVNVADIYSQSKKRMELFKSLNLNLSKSEE